MPDQLFLYDYKTSRAYDWQKVLSDLKELNQISLFCYTADLYEVFLKIISAVLYNVPLTLLDADFSSTEISSLHLDKVDLQATQTVIPLQINAVNDLLQIIQAHHDWSLTLFTSGTTGLPKRVTHTLASLTRGVRIAAKHREAVWGFAYNPTHMAGLQVFFQALLNANPLINLFNASRELVLNLLCDYGITHISATPTFFRLLLPLSDTYPSICKLTSGGERFDVSLAASLCQAFPNATLRNVYASTEAGTILTSRDEGFSICDESICRIIDNELYIHHGLLGQGTEPGPDNNEWYATGDLVEIISEDPLVFRFLHRKNEMINVGGSKVDPAEVERLLQTHPAVSQAYVYGKPNPLVGSILMADIVQSAPVTEKELRSFLSPLLQSYKIPRCFNFVPTLELTRSGKLKRT